MWVQVITCTMAPILQIRITNMLTLPRVHTCSTRETYRIFTGDRKCRTAVRELCRSYLAYRTSVMLATKSSKIRGCLLFKEHTHWVESLSCLVATHRTRSFTQAEWDQTATASLRTETVRSASQSSRVSTATTMRAQGTTAWRGSPLTYKPHSIRCRFSHSRAHRPSAYKRRLLCKSAWSLST